MIIGLVWDNDGYIMMVNTWIISHVPIFHITQPLDSIRYMVYNGYYSSIIPWFCCRGYMLIIGIFSSVYRWESSPKIWMIDKLNMGVSENVVYPIFPNGFADHYPDFKWLFLGNIAYFQPTHMLIIGV